MNFDPEAYTLTIRKENIDGDILFIGRVSELQDVIAYEETYEEAHSILLDAISSLKQIADEQNRTFPVPFETEDRLPMARKICKKFLNFIRKVFWGKIAKKFFRIDFYK